MFSTPETLDDIKAWARNGFPDEFEKVQDYLLGNRLAIEGWNIRKQPYDLNMSAWKSRIFGCIVGSTAQQEELQSVFASIHGRTGTLQLRYATHIVPQGLFGQNKIWFSPAKHVGVEDLSKLKTSFTEPFSWLHPGRDDAGFARLEALVQYMFLCLGPDNMLDLDVEQFKKRFEEACCTIAAVLASPACNEQLPSPHVALKDKPQPQTGCVATTRLPVCTANAPTTAPRKRLRSTEEILTSIRGDLDEIMTTTQKADQKEKERLHGRIQSLEEKAASAEKERDEYKAGMAAAEEKANTAEQKMRKTEEEAAKSKEEYRELKQSMRQKATLYYEDLHKMF